MTRPSRPLAAILLVTATVAALLVPVPAQPASAAVVPLLCSSGSDWNGLHNPPNTWPEIMEGRVRFPATAVADLTPSGGGGKVSWAMDPFSNGGWRKWLLSLKWVGSLVVRASGRSDIVAGSPVPPTALQRRVAIDTAVRYVRDYVGNVPPGRFGSVERATGNHRVHAMTCVLDAWIRVYSDLGLPAPETGWLRTGLAQQAAALQATDRGVWAATNQGLDDAQAVMLAGCVTGDQALLSWATSRFHELAAATIDDEGITIEQSVGYSQYLWSRWKLVAEKAEGCGLSLPPSLSSKLDLVAEFVVHATRPDGRYAQIGDTYANPRNYAPQPRGTAGLPLAKAYSNGWAFVRSSWSPWAAHLTMRYGPPRGYHGHFDHTSLTFFARGHEVISDSGHVGYDQGSLRKYIWSPEAHSVVSAKAAWIRRPNSRSSATLTTFLPNPTGAKLSVSDAGFPSISRNRSVELRTDLNALLTVDRVKSTRSGRVAYTQRWVLPPGWSVTKKARTTFVAARGTERITLIRVPVGTQAGRTGRSDPFGPRGATVVSGRVGVDQGRILANKHVLFTDNRAATIFATVIVAHAATTSVSAKAAPAGGAACVQVVAGANSTTMCG